MTATTTASLSLSVPTLNLLHLDGWARRVYAPEREWFEGRNDPYTLRARRWPGPQVLSGSARGAFLHHAAHVGHPAAHAAAAVLVRAPRRRWPPW